ncbi:hypothetical protein [Rhizobium sp. IMFF44]|uniref:hypothetical protein n=1 Tax=Rhizobium sp. IMFF44 TaxID=3342350 RepID=UPI0035B93D1C
MVTYVSSTPALSNNFTIGAIVLVAPFPLSLALFYWRYRVPLALALFLFSLFGLFLAAVFYVAGTVTASSNVPADRRRQDKSDQVLKRKWMTSPS